MEEGAGSVEISGPRSCLLKNGRPRDRLLERNLHHERSRLTQPENYPLEKPGLDKAIAAIVRGLRCAEGEQPGAGSCAVYSRQLAS